MERADFYNLLEHPELFNAETLTGLKELTAEHPCFQAAWVLYLKNLKITGDPRFEKILKKVAVTVPDRKQLHHYLNKNSLAELNFRQQEFQIPAFDLGNDEGAHSGNSLIDRFLSSKPSTIRFEKNTGDHYSEDSDNEVVDKSVSENDEIITETLAMIYLEQKKYDKALDAFQKLSLKYPEKSIYFATRIEEIEKLKNI